jgi:uncharacterized membrane protein YoaK (UPF0700 family)
LSVSAGVLILCFVAGVVVASMCRRRFWVAHPHGPTVLTTFSLFVAMVFGIIDDGWEEVNLDLAPIMLVVFGVGALNTSFVKDGEVSVPVSYVTGTLVKMGQGLERHIAGGNVTEWLGHFLLVASFVLGAAFGGGMSLILNGTGMLIAATVICALTTGYTYFHQDRRALLD